jgi:hypothetical protein
MAYLVESMGTSCAYRRVASCVDQSHTRTTDSLPPSRHIDSCLTDASLPILDGLSVRVPQ